MNQLHFSYINFITCNFSSTNRHILKHSKILPCGNTTCYDCIRSNLKMNNQLVCPFENCKQVHEISNLDDLITNKSVEQAIDDNLVYLKSVLTKELEEKLVILTICYNQNRERIVRQFESTEINVKLHTQLLISELQRIEKIFLDRIKVSKETFLEINEKKFQMESLKTSMSNGNNLNSLKNDNIELEVMKNSLYRFHNCLQNLSKLEESLKEDIEHLKFLPSRWLPDISNFGEIFENQNLASYDVNMNNILDASSNSNAIHLSCGIEKISKMCNLNDKRLVLLSNQDLMNELTIIDDKFIFQSRFCSIGSRKFKQLVSLCSDDLENIYLADGGASQIMILDNEFSVIKRTIGKKGTKNGEFNGLLDICFFDGHLHALDKCKRVQIFSKQGDFIRSIKLYRNNTKEEDESNGVGAKSVSKSVEKFLDQPISLRGYNETLAVLDDEKSIYIYNMDGYLKQIIKCESSNQINLFCFGANFLYILYDPTILECWTYVAEDNVYASKVQKSINNFKDYYSDMCCFKGQWIFSSYFNGRLTILLK